VGTVFAVVVVCEVFFNESIFVFVFFCACAALSAADTICRSCCTGGTGVPERVLRQRDLRHNHRQVRVSLLCVCVCVCVSVCSLLTFVWLASRVLGPGANVTMALADWTVRLVRI